VKKSYVALGKVTRLGREILKKSEGKKTGAPQHDTVAGAATGEDHKRRDAPGDWGARSHRVQQTLRMKGEQIKPISNRNIKTR